MKTTPFLKAHELWFKYLHQSDAEKMNVLLHPDCTLGFVGGSYGIRENFLLSLRNGNLKYLEVKRGCTHLQSFENIGIVTGEVDLTYQSGTNSPQLEQLSYTAIYKLNGESTEMLAWQSTWRNKPFEYNCQIKK